MKTNIIACSMILFIVMFSSIPFVQAEKNAPERVTESKSILPENIISIEKSNTMPNVSEDYEVIESNALTKDLIKDLKIPFENPELIKLLNETTVKPSLIGIGYRGMIYLGRWPLTYESNERNVSADYQQVNVNEINNVEGTATQKLRYIQQKEHIVKGALSTKVEHSEVIKKMILQKTKAATDLPLSFKAIVGTNSKLENYYHVPVKKQGYLQAYVPAINEKGTVTFGDVYIELKGTSKSIVVKNVTTQTVGAWIPIQNHIALTFQLD